MAGLDVIINKIKYDVHRYFHKNGCLWKGAILYFVVYCLKLLLSYQHHFVECKIIEQWLR